VTTHPSAARRAALLLWLGALMSGRLIAYL
jgi:hypothetical protein